LKKSQSGCSSDVRCDYIIFTDISVISTITSGAYSKSLLLEFWIYVHNSRLHFGAVLKSYSISSLLVSTYSSRVCTLQVLYPLTIHLVSPFQTRCLSTSPGCSRIFNTCGGPALPVSSSRFINTDAKREQSADGTIGEPEKTACHHELQLVHVHFCWLSTYPLSSWLISAVGYMRKTLVICQQIVL
jgi:hypothetical protein